MLCFNESECSNSDFICLECLCPADLYLPSCMVSVFDDVTGVLVFNMRLIQGGDMPASVVLAFGLMKGRSACRRILHGIVKAAVLTSFFSPPAFPTSVCRDQILLLSTWSEKLT